MRYRVYAKPELEKTVLRNNITVEELAKKCGRTAPWVYALFSDRVPVLSRQRKAILKLFPDKTFDDLFILREVGGN